MYQKKARRSSIFSIVAHRNKLDVENDAFIYHCIPYLNLKEILTIWTMSLPKMVVMRNSSFWSLVKSLHFGPFVLSDHSVGCADSFSEVSQLYKRLHSFRTPYMKRRITFVGDHDSVAYVNARIDVNKLGSMDNDIADGVYVELGVYANADNLSLCLVDFDGSGSSSITFSPDAGAVIKERKMPATSGVRILSGEYCNPLCSARNFGCESSQAAMAVYIAKTGDVYFARRQTAFSKWEVTASIGNCSCWVTGKKIVTPCIAFRDPGDYDVRIHQVTVRRPSYIVLPNPGQNPSTLSRRYDWKTLNWEGDPRDEIPFVDHQDGEIL